MTRVDDIQNLLNDAGFAGAWSVTSPAHGSTGRAFVARRGGEAVFIKLGSAHPPHGRLAALGMTPPLLAHGPAFTISR